MSLTTDTDDALPYRMNTKWPHFNELKRDGMSEREQKMAFSNKLLGNRYVEKWPNCKKTDPDSFATQFYSFFDDCIC